MWCERYGKSYVKRQVGSCLVFIFLVFGVLLYSGCTNDSNAASTDAAVSSNKVEERNKQIVREKNLEEVVSQAYGEAELYLSKKIETRLNATPVIAQFGEQIQVSGRVAVTVLSVEPGPYDYADKCNTVMVTVQITNTSDRTFLAKASNWNADTNDGLRVNHKYWVIGSDGKKEAESFGIVRISPNKSFEGQLYFDGDELEAIVFEPHWLISGENEYIYFVKNVSKG